MRNNVPGGESVGESPPPGVDRAGGRTGDGLIERLRETIRVLEQVPVSLTFPPASSSGPHPDPACSFFLAQGDPLPARSAFGRSEGGQSQTQNLPFTPLPTLPHEGGEEDCGAVPLHKLEAAGLHEVKPASYRDAPAALAFALAVLALRVVPRGGEKTSTLFWCLTERAAREWGVPYGPGLLALGLDPASILLVKARNAVDAAWALEEGLKAGSFTAALGQIEVKAPLIARRLGLAARASRTPCLLVSSHRGHGLPGTLTRWRIEAASSGPAPFDASAPGAAAWRLVLERCRGAMMGRSWSVEYRDDAYGVGVVAELADREIEAGEGRRASSG